MQFPMPPSDTPIDPPGPALQFFACILIVIAAVELIVFNLPDKWRDRISALQFGQRWTAKRRERP
jgi:hypothetical protein